MKSVRFSDELERKLMEVANLEGKTQSEVIRQAIEREYERTTERRLDAEIGDLVGTLALSGDRARTTGETFKESIHQDKKSS